LLNNGIDFISFLFVVATIGQLLTYRALFYSSTYSILKERLPRGPGAFAISRVFCQARIAGFVVFAFVFSSVSAYQVKKSNRFVGKCCRKRLIFLVSVGGLVPGSLKRGPIIFLQPRLEHIGVHPNMLRGKRLETRRSTVDCSKTDP